MTIARATVGHLVDRERARIGRLIAGWGVAIAAAGICAALGVAVFALGRGRWMALPAPLPVIAWIAVAAFVGLAISLTIRRLTVEATQRRVAKAIEHDRHLRRGSLRGALEIADDRSGAVGGGSGALGRRGAEQVAEQLAGSRVLAPGTRGRARARTLVVVGLALVAVATLGAAALTVPDGWTALAHPIRAWRGALLPELQIDVPHDVARGQPVRVRVVAAGRERIAVQRRVTGASWVTTWYPVLGGYAKFVTDPVDADLTLLATDGRAVSDTVMVRAVDRPFVGGIALRAEYPAYLRRAAEVLPAGEVANVPRGTRVEIAGRASTELAHVALVRGAGRDADSVAMRVDGRRFAGRLVAEPSAAGRWDWRAAGVGAPITDVPVALELTVIPDSAPTVDILAPAHDTVVGVGDNVALALVAADDHGLSSIVLRSRRVPASGPAQPDVVQRVADSAGARWTGEAMLDLAARGLQPGDALHVAAEVTDNSPWHQTGMSRELVLRVPSLSEQRTLVRNAADSTVALASTTAAAERQLQQRTEEAARARGQRSASASSSPSSTGGGAGRTERSSSLPYQSAEQARALAAEQRQLAGRMDSLRKATQQLERKLQQAGALDSGLASRLHEAQRLLNDALTPELRSQLQQLEQSAASLRNGDTRQSLSDLAQQQQQLRESLERTLDVLKRAALEGSMQTLRDEARDIAKAEHAQAQHPGQSERPPTPPAGTNAQQPAPSPQGAEQQLANRSRDLSRDVGQLAKRLADAQAQTGAHQVGAARERVDSSAQAMSGRDAQTAASQMDRAAQQLADARQAQVGEWKSNLTNELDRSIQETMQLAQQERELAQQAQASQQQSGSGGAKSQDRAQLEAQQSAVQQGTDRTSERLQRAGRQSALISSGAQRAVGQARAKVQQATQELRDPQGGGMGAGQPQQSAAAMRDAAQALTDAAGALVRDRERAANASSSSGLAEMLQQMQQLAQQQGQLNAQAQGMSLMPGGGRGQQGAQGLAQGERQLARSLDQVGQGEAGGGADALAREARQIADALERSGLDPATIARQQRLYHRLLDAGHTLEQDERDSTGKRQAQAATGRELFTPTNTTAEGRAAMKYPEPTWSELRDLPADERQIVIDYFKRINATAPVQQ